MFEGPSLDHLEQLGQGAEQEVGRLGEDDAGRRVEHIRGCEAVVGPPRGLGAGRFAEKVDECGQVVVGDLLPASDILRGGAGGGPE